MTTKSTLWSISIVAHFRSVTWTIECLARNEPAQ